LDLTHLKFKIVQDMKDLKPATITN